MLAYNKYYPKEFNFIINKERLALKGFGNIICDGMIHIFDMIVIFDKQIQKIC